MAEVAIRGADDFKIRCENIAVGELVKDFSVYTGKIRC